MLQRKRNYITFEKERRSGISLNSFSPAIFNLSYHGNYCGYNLPAVEKFIKFYDDYGDTAEATWPKLVQISDTQGLFLGNTKREFLRRKRKKKNSSTSVYKWNLFIFHDGTDNSFCLLNYRVGFPCGILLVSWRPNSANHEYKFRGIIPSAFYYFFLFTKGSFFYSVLTSLRTTSP